MTWKSRQSLGQCAYAGCDDEPMEGNNECRLHWLMGLDRKRYWWTYRRFARRPVQLELGL